MPGQNEAVKFYDYKAWLPANHIDHVLLLAESEACQHLGEHLISRQLVYTTDRVQMILFPRRGLNWWAWSTALWGICMTVEDHGMFFAWKFKIISRTLGEIGSGSLTERRRDFVQTSKREESGREPTRLAASAYRCFRRPSIQASH